MSGAWNGCLCVATQPTAPSSKLTRSTVKSAARPGSENARSSTVLAASSATHSRTAGVLISSAAAWAMAPSTSSVSSDDETTCPSRARIRRRAARISAASKRRALSSAMAACAAKALSTSVSAAVGTCGSHQYTASAPCGRPLITMGTESVARYPSRATRARLASSREMAGSANRSADQIGTPWAKARPVVPSPGRILSPRMNSGDRPAPRS